MNRSKKKISILLLTLMVIQMFTPFLDLVVYAEKETIIDSITLEDAGKLNGKPAYDLKAEWSIEDKTKKKGEEFTLQLPDDLEMQFLPETLYLNSPDGKVYAEGKIEGNTIKFTFTELVESDLNIHGSFYIDGLTTKKGDDGEGIVDKDVPIKEDNKIIWEGSIKVDTGTVVGEGGGDYYSHNFRKNPQDGSYNIAREDGYIKLTWNIDINTTENDQYEGNIVIKDTVDGSQIIDSESFNLEYLRVYGIDESIKGIDNLRNTNKDDIRVNSLKISEDRKSFELDIDVDGNYGYVLWYETKIPVEDYLKDLSLGMESYKNHISVEYDGKEIEASTGEYAFSKLGQVQDGNIPYYGDGKISIIKTDETGQKLENAKFKIEKYDPSQVQENKWIIIENEVNLGEYEKENFKSGIYKFTELEAPEGYIKLKDPIIKTIDFELINDLKKNLNSKKDDLKKIKEKKNADIEKYNEIIEKLEVEKENGKDIFDDDNYDIYLKLWSLNSELADYLRDNKVEIDYAIEQIKNKVKGEESEHIKEEKEIREIKNNLESQGYNLEKEAIGITLKNKKNIKNLKLVKKWDGLEAYKGNLNKLRAEFEIFAYKLKDGRPTPLDSGELENIIGTKEDPKIYEIPYEEGKENFIEIDLPYLDEEGNEYVYTVKELDLANFDKEDDKSFKVSDYTDEDKIELEFTNTYKKPKTILLKVKKVDSKDENKVLEGVKFGIYIEKDLLEEKVTNAEGILEFGNLEAGEYTIKELETADGYILDDTPIEIEVRETSKGLEILKKSDSEDDKLLENEQLLVKNKKNIKSLKLVKKWDGLEDYKGNLNELKAKFQISAYKLKNGEKRDLEKDELENIIGTKEDPKIYEIPYEEGKENFIEIDLPYLDEEGNEYVYTVKELDLANFDKEDDKSFKVSDYTDEDKIELEFTNTYKKPKTILLKVKKVDSKDENKVLEGVKFGIYNGKDLLEEKVTNAEGVLEFGNLEAGEYTIKELETADGYILDDTPIEIEVKETSKGLEILKKSDSEDDKLLENKLLLVENDPEEPTEPDNPDPEEPTEPDNPDPEEPTEPDNPDPEEPTEPDNPDPEEPTEPDNPEPEEPTEPDNPDPEEPTEPDNPDPEEPIEPDNPEPEEPTEPDNPEPEEPIEPDNPEPEEPIEPDNPEPEEPIEPDNPDPEEPIEPDEPEDPTNPENIEPEETPDPEEPMDIEKPGPEKPGKPIYPSETETLDKDKLNSEKLNEKDEMKYLPKTGYNLNSRLYGLVILTLGILLLLMVVKDKENNK